MAKIVLDPVTNGATLTTLNANFDKIESEFQNRVAYRDNVSGETNTVRNDFDMDGNDIFNVNALNIDHLVVDGITIPGSDLQSIPAMREDIAELQTNLGNTNTALTALSGIVDNNAAIEDAHDKKSVRLAVGNIPVLNETTGRAGKFIAFDALGNPLTSFGTGADLGLRSDLATSNGTNLVGFIQDGTGAVLRSVDEQLKAFPVTPEEFDPGPADKSLPIQLGFNTIKSRLGLAIQQSTMRYGARTIELEPGIYDFGTTLELDGDAKIVAKGPKGSVILRYTGSNIAVVVNSSQLTLTGAPNNVRVFEWNNIALRGDNATEGIRIGANTNLSVLFQGAEVSGIQGPPINCGASVYFLALRNFTARFNQQPIFVGEYCDMFTVDDRSLFMGNYNGALMLECPTAFISNSDFELNSGLADITIRNKAIIANNRNILLFKNRHGSEVYVGRTPVQYDVAVVEEAGLPSGSGLTNLQLWSNDHFSGGSFAKKTAPILLDARSRRFDIRGEKFAGATFLQPYLIMPGADQSFPVSTGAVYNSITDDIAEVHPSLRGLFSGRMPNYRRIRAATVQPAFTVLYAVSSTTVPGVDSNMLSCTALVPSGSKTNYNKAVGLTVAATVATQPTWIADNGSVVITTLDGTGGAHWDSIYLGASGQLTRTAPGDPNAVLRVGRLLTTGVNAQVLIDIQRVD